MSGDTLVNAETGEIIAECTPDEARKILDRMHTGMGVVTELYIEAYTKRVWAALGHASWDAFITAEFGKYQLRLPSEERDEMVMSLRAAGLSIRAIAATGVASKNTVERTIGTFLSPAASPSATVVRIPPSFGPSPSTPVGITLAENSMPSSPSARRMMDVVFISTVAPLRCRAARFRTWECGGRARPRA